MLKESKKIKQQKLLLFLNKISMKSETILVYICILNLQDHIDQNTFIN